MDHDEALQLQAAEKYVLGELPPSQRDEFEEHFFECQECALDVKATAGFVDNVRGLPSIFGQTDKYREIRARPQVILMPQVRLSSGQLYPPWVKFMLPFFDTSTRGTVR